MGKTAASGSNVSLLSRMAVVAVSVGVELVRDMWCVIAGFLKDHHMEAAAGCGKDLCGFSACWAWVPLEHREAVLVVDEATDRVGEGDVEGRFGFTKTCKRKHNGRQLGKGFVPCAVGVVGAGLCSRFGGTSSWNLWFGLWSSLGGTKSQGSGSTMVTSVCVVWRVGTGHKGSRLVDTFEVGPCWGCRLAAASATRHGPGCVCNRW